MQQCTEGITAYRSHGDSLEHAQQIANHSSPRTTKLYDRRKDAISLDEVERIAIWDGYSASLHPMTSRLSGIGPVTISSAGETVVAPPPQLLSNLPLLHRILNDVIEDWHRAVAPYDAKMAETTNPDGVMAVAFLELQPALLKCLFSYVFFLVAADQTYDALYARLNEANKTARVLHGKPPIATALVKKAHLIRDVSIAYFPSNKASHIDAWAGMSWQPMALSSGPNGWNLT